jgi:putative FmdB family regulatory protein
MPIYEYRCKKCGDFEVTQKITDRSLTRCPTCSRKVTKLISNTSFQLKGSGWYATDYAGKSGKTTEPAKASASESKTDSKTDSKTESKSESKSESKAEKSESSASKPPKASEAAAA